MPRVKFFSLVLTLFVLQSTVAAQIDVLQRSFLDPPDDSRIMMRWWWFGPAVDNAQLEREMRLMKEGGIGGFEVQPVYPLSLDENIRISPFLSPEYLNALRFTADKAKELGASLMVPPTDIAKVGRFSIINDPQGAVFAVIHLTGVQ